MDRDHHLKKKNIYKIKSKMLCAFLYIFFRLLLTPRITFSLHLNTYILARVFQRPYLWVWVFFYFKIKTPVHRSLDFSRLKIAKMKLVDDEKLTSEPSHSYGMMMMMSVQEKYLRKINIYLGGGIDRQAISIDGPIVFVYSRRNTGVACSQHIRAYSSIKTQIEFFFFPSWNLWTHLWCVVALF